MGKIIDSVRAHNERVSKRLMEQAAIEARIEQCRRHIEGRQMAIQLQQAQNSRENDTMTTEPKDWIFEGTPTENGWHAVLFSWSEEEGVFPGADCWNGAAWERGYPTLAIAGPFTSLGTAEAWARAHDPNELYAQSLKGASPPTETGKVVAPEMLTPAWEPLTPERLAKLRQEPAPATYWVAIKGERKPDVGAFFAHMDGFETATRDTPAADVTHIMPFTTPEMPK